MACVPPVELPSTTGLLTDSACRPASGGRAAGLAMAAPPAARRGIAAWLRGRERAAAFSVCTSSRRDSSRNCFSPSRGLDTTATAPADSASSAISLPWVVSVEQITVGMGQSAISWRRKVRPSMPGISMSSSSTSGRFLRITGPAISGLGALPISTSSGSPWSRCIRVWRTTAESSTTYTLTAISRPHTSTRTTSGSPGPTVHARRR